jgi:transposase
MWTPQNRKRYDRSRLRYPSDLTDEEWAHVAPVIPPAKPGGNKRTVDVREVMRWIVERTLAWLNRCRRLSKDWENLNRTALAFLRLRCCRGSGWN